MPRAKKTTSRIDAERVRLALMGSENMIRGLSAERLARALDDFRRGWLREAAVLWQIIRERDDTTLAVTEKRDLDAALLDYEILPVDDSPEAERDKQALKAAYNGLTATDALDQNKRGGVAALIKMMMHAVGHRWAVFELIWDPSGEDLTAEFRFVPLQFFEHTVGRLRFLPVEGAYQGEDLEDGGWMVVCGPGLMQATSIAYFLKRSPLRAWAILCDKFAVPYLHGESSAQVGSKEWNAFRDALASLVNDGAVLTSPGAKITPITITGAEAPAEALVDRCDRGITRIWRGADLGTMSKDGAAVGSNPQASETDILSAADAQNISETLNYYFDRQVIRYRFGTEPKAYFKLKPRTKINQDLQLKIDDQLIKWGCKLGIKDLMERYGRAEADAGEEVAIASVPPSPFEAQASTAVVPAALVNEAASNRVALVARAAAQARPAEQAILDPILRRLAAIEAMPDPAAQRAALQELRAAWPVLGRAALQQVPALAQAIEQAIAPAVVSGLAEVPKSSPQNA
ncbi:DUF935 domain-containing protein [Horticoccus luteus]|uniref:DUF935 domain-containing protein n=1 Tax=Horticoccus luteus TaxID=2862869 RepID=A0A8F9TW13_9BACT|nr:DUF935 family protein [Horticoccus luteus]QYM80279.1 DUF935 domain-containing protein [Horticoccus luteus]